MARLANTYRANKPSKSKGQGRIRRLEIRLQRQAAEIVVQPVVQIDDTPVVRIDDRETKLAARRERDRLARAKKRAIAA